MTKGNVFNPHYFRFGFIPKQQSELTRYQIISILDSSRIRKGFLCVNGVSAAFRVKSQLYDSLNMTVFITSSKPSHGQQYCSKAVRSGVDCLESYSGTQLLFGGDAHANRNKRRNHRARQVFTACKHCLQSQFNIIQEL